MLLLKRFIVLLFSLFLFWGCITELQSQEDRPLKNLLGNIVEDGLRDLAEVIKPSPVRINEMTPDMAYRQLVAGNARYMKNDTQNADTIPIPLEDPNATPLVTIFYSPEMRTTPDYIFDLSPSHLYQVPARASVFTSEELDDLEYGIVNLRTPLVVVLTHSPSREIERLLSVWTTLDQEARTRIQNTQVFFSGNNTRPQKDDELLYSLAGPAVARAMVAYPNSTRNELSRYIAEGIAWESIEAMLMQSPALRSLISRGKVDLVAATLDEMTGEVEWLGRHPLTAEFLKTVPQTVVTRYGTGSFREAELPPALSQNEVERYLSNDEANRYYVDVTNEYYYRPAPSIPSWNLFRPDVWQYRPWFGVWVPSFAPLPSYHPWYYRSTRSYPYCIPDRHFYIGFNWGYNYHHIPVGFHPHDPRWDKPFFLDPTLGPGWQPGSPWDDIWHHGPQPGFHPQPNGYHGPIGPFDPGDPHWGNWRPGDQHPGWGQPGRNPHRDDPWHKDPPDWFHHDQPGERGGHNGNDRPGGQGNPNGNDRPGGQGGHNGNDRPGGLRQPWNGIHRGDTKPNTQTVQGRINHLTPQASSPERPNSGTSSPFVTIHRIPQNQRPSEPQTIPHFGGFHPSGGAPKIRWPESQPTEISKPANRVPTTNTESNQPKTVRFQGGQNGLRHPNMRTIRF